MFGTPPNWMGLLLAAVLFSMVLAVTPFVTPRGQITLSPATNVGVYRVTLVEVRDGEEE